MVFKNNQDSPYMYQSKEIMYPTKKNNNNTINNTINNTSNNDHSY